MKKLFPWLLLLIVLAFSACKKEKSSGEFALQLQHVFDSKNFVLDKNSYVNAAGDTLIFTDLQYFISDVEIRNKNGEKILFTLNNFAHYIDVRDTASYTWVFPEKIDAGLYDQITFRFGLAKEKNLSGIFRNPPQCNMFWPESMGGGYHYMKLNGRWQTADTTEAVGNSGLFGFHTGVGAVEGVPVFDNSFDVQIDKNFAVSNGIRNTLTITMDVAQWFTNPTDWSFKTWGGSIMSNQEAQATIKENGKTVFK